MEYEDEKMLCLSASGRIGKGVKEYLEIIGFCVFMAGLFFALPVLVFLWGWLDFIGWQGLGDNTVKLFDRTRFIQYISDPYLWLVIGLILVIEVIVIVLTSRNHPHFRTMM